MSLNEHTKRQLNDIVNLIDDKIDNRIQDAKDELSVESQKNRFTHGKSSGLGRILKKEMDSIQDVVKGKYLSHSFELKAADITESSGSGSYILEDYGGERSSLRSYFNLASLFPNYNVSGGSVRFVTENSEDSQFGIVAEAAAATQSDVQFKEVKKSLETIRSYATISEELLSDGNLESMIRNRFVQMLINKQNNELINGTGNISSLSGIKLIVLQIQV